MKFNIHMDIVVTGLNGTYIGDTLLKKTEVVTCSCYVSAFCRCHCPECSMENVIG